MTTTTIKDVTGEEVDVKVLIERLKYRQRHPAIAVEAKLLPDHMLNGFICSNNHFREGVRLSKDCTTCEGFWRYQIAEGILVHASSGKVVTR